MPTVYHAGSHNSTFFTTCCRTAIGDDELKCPGCGEAVTPVGRRARWYQAHHHDQSWKSRGMGI